MSHILIPTGGFPPDIGGPATYVPHIATALCEHGHQVTAVTLTPAQGHDDSIYPFQVVRLPQNSGRIQRWLTVLTTLLRLMRTADVVYVNGLLLETAVASLFRRRHMAAKVVGDIVWERAQDKGWVTDSIDVFQHTAYRWPIELRRWLRGWAIRRMAYVIVPSRYLQRIVTGWGINEARTTVIYNAYQPPVGEPATGLTTPQTPFTLVTVCRLVRWKQVDVLISLLPRLPDVGLLVVGDGSEREQLEQIAHNQGVADRVQFTGNVPRTTVNAALNSADLFVLNSTYEGLPHVLLEALAANLPIVATDVGGVAEVVQDGINGRLVLPNDPEQLLAAIQEVRHNREKYRVTLPDRFSRETMIDQTLTLLLQKRGQT